MGIFEFIGRLVAKKSGDIFDILKINDIAIDCGANVGNITKQMAERGAVVYAFEPNPHAFKVLEEKFKNDHNVHCVNKGALDRNTKMPLYMHENSDQDEVYWSQGTSLLDFKGNVNKEKFVEVELIDLSEFIEKLGQRVKLLKMDVEGVEYEILNKLIETNVYKLIDLILVETHEKKITELRDKHEALIEKIKNENITNIDLTWR